MNEFVSPHNIPDQWRQPISEQALGRRDARLYRALKLTAFAAPPTVGCFLDTELQTEVPLRMGCRSQADYKRYIHEFIAAGSQPILSSAPVSLLQVGDRFVIADSQENRRRATPNIIRKITPSPIWLSDLPYDFMQATFRGFMEATLYALDSVSDRMNDEEIVDIGSGGGILALAALSNGAARAHLIEQNGWYARQADRNLEQNNVGEKSTVYCQTADEVRQSKTFPREQIGVAISNIGGHAVYGGLPNLLKVFDFIEDLPCVHTVVLGGFGSVKTDEAYIPLLQWLGQQGFTEFSRKVIPHLFLKGKIAYPLMHETLVGMR
ncbi:50S ribosomal protein L11 methyltransferase [Candidatus Roizmanbacteria bacterium]|nr:50S ribosomal protein L11 methyltransferase [Candidatus Roizmanbacteria bacterium]